MTYRESVLRSLLLAGHALRSWLDALVEFVAFCLLCVGLIFFLGPAVEWARGRSATMRTLSARWCGVDVPSPYRPPPPEPERERDGWYRDGNQLYKSDRWLRIVRRFTWTLEDPANSREYAWQLVNPLVTLFLPIAAVVSGPLALRGYGHWTRWWLGPRPKRECPRRLRGLEALGHQMGLFALAVVHFVVWLPAAVVLLGLMPLAPGLVVVTRTIADTFRREAGNWTGVRIARPYLPHPPFPMPRADGLYRFGKQLYDQPWWPARMERLRWVLRDRATWRDLAATVLNAPVQLVLLAPTFVLVFGGFIGLIMLWVVRTIGYFTHTPSWMTTHWFAMVGLPEASSTLSALALTPVAVAAMALGLLPTRWLARQQARYGRLLLGPTEATRLAQRVDRLQETRSDVNVAQAAELRRIERDLHDGIQARLVAMGMKLGAVEVLIDNDPAAAKQLTADLRKASSDALTELRLLIRGIHPPVLSDRGLAAAIRAVALDSPLKAEVVGSLEGRLEEPVEACAYFAVHELLSNAAKHGSARHATITLSFDDGLLRIVVVDDGTGGAVPARGTGLRGIERRLGAFDGRFSLDSPLGGPTRATLEIPCQLDPEPSSPKTSTSSETASPTS